MLHTCTRLSETVDERWKNTLAVDFLYSPFNPSQLNLTKDIQLSLPHTHEYISSITIHQHHHRNPISIPSLHIQGTLNDLLSLEGRLFREAYLDDPILTLRNVEHLVEKDIDNWVSSVENVDKACVQLDTLIAQYMSSVYELSDYKDRPKYWSTLTLTAAELWVAIDKLVTSEISILTDYSPQISSTFLSQVLLPDPMSIYHIRRLCQYLSDRHHGAYQGWSVLSSGFTDNSFPVWYFNGSANLQHLKDRIGKHLLPSEPRDAKAVIFELQPPISFQIWQSITYLLAGSSSELQHITRAIHNVVPELQPYCIRYPRSNIHLDFSSPEDRVGLQYYNTVGLDSDNWELHKLFTSGGKTYQLPAGPYRYSGLQKYLDVTGHTPNQVLSAQGQCHPDLPLHEFITFAHLWSGGVLQWINILRELRSRSLNFRRYENFLLLAQASGQVGFLSDRGDLLWHQDLQDPSFCYVLLDGLENLFIDLSAGLCDGPGMAIISWLAHSVATNMSKDIVEWATQLLRNICQRPLIGCKVSSMTWSNHQMKKATSF
ncbi:hypothetical protein JVU11DRAFT_8583 [Chiua virens]|nr:hypothetical protein JVU11DRAFT_8583 [Chiua virens]